MFGGFDRLSSTCLTPLCRGRRQQSLSLAGIFAMAAAMSLPAPSLAGAAQAASAEIPRPPTNERAAIGTLSEDARAKKDWLTLLQSGADGDGPVLLAQSAPPPPSGGTIIDGGEGVVPFPRPTDSTPDDGGQPPQVSKPALNTPDLLVTKPRTVPDLEGRFSNGGNEEIW